MLKKKKKKNQRSTSLLCSVCIFKKIPQRKVKCLSVWVKTGLFCCNNEEDLEGHLITSWQVSLCTE